MKGKIKAYSNSVNAGVIAGYDGKNYQFSLKEWLDNAPPINNQEVNFSPQKERAFQVNICTDETREV